MIYTDASLTRWGITNHNIPSRGLWHKSGLDNINVLELKVIKIVVQTYCGNKTYMHVRIRCDNITAITYTNNMGGVKYKSCNEIAL